MALERQPPRAKSRYYCTLQSTDDGCECKDAYEDIGRHNVHSIKVMLALRELHAWLCNSADVDVAQRPNETICNLYARKEKEHIP